MYKFKEGHSKNFKRELTFDYFLWKKFNKMFLIELLIKSSCYTYIIKS
jgi:hypothetical protein